MSPQWARFLPLLLLLPLPSATQTTAASSETSHDSICLSEILINTPQPYDPAQVADAERKADSAREAIRQGAKFEDTAKRHSDGPTATYGGSLGTFKRGQLAKSIEDVAFAMKVGDVSDVIRTKQGFAILKVTECGLVSDTRVRRRYGNVEILTETFGVDFGPYLQNVVKVVKANWYARIPETMKIKRASLAIEFAIMKDGHVQGLVVRPSSGDSILDSWASASITASDPFPRLPEKFTGPDLQLRFRFYYNPDKADLDASDKDKAD
jgi:hypothetical protein